MHQQLRIERWTAVRCLRSCLSQLEGKLSGNLGSLGDGAIRRRLVPLHKRSLLQRSSTCRRAPHFALHKGIAIGFLKATGFRNKPKRTK